MSRPNPRSRRPARSARAPASRAKVPVASAMVPKPAVAPAVTPSTPSATPAGPKAVAVSLAGVPAHCDFDRVDSTSMFNTLGGIRALPSHEASAAIARRTLAEARGYEEADLMAIAEVGYHYLRSGGFKLAQVIFEGLTAVNPQEPYYWLALGLSEDRVGHPQQARAAYENVIALDPRDATPELNLAELDVGEGRRKSARRRLAIARKKAARAGQTALANKADAMTLLLGA